MTEEQKEKKNIFDIIIKRAMVPDGFFSEPKKPNYNDGLMIDRLMETIAALWKMGFHHYAGIVFMLKWVWFPARTIKLPHFHSQGPQILAQQKGILSYYCTYLIDEKQRRIDDENSNIFSYPIAAVAVGSRKGCEKLPLLKKIVKLTDLEKMSVSIVKNTGNWYLKQKKSDGKNNAVWSKHSAQKWETCAGNRLIRHYFAEALASCGINFTEDSFPEEEVSEKANRAQSWGENKSASVEPKEEAERPEEDTPPPQIESESEQRDESLKEPEPKDRFAQWAN